jgi:hypothetical protein
MMAELVSLLLLYSSRGFVAVCCDHLRSIVSFFIYLFWGSDRSFLEWSGLRPVTDHYDQNDLFDSTRLLTFSLNATLTRHVKEEARKEKRER